MVIGRYLVPSVDADTAPTAKILKNKRQRFHSSTYCGLSPEELVRYDHVASWNNFEEWLEVDLG